MLCIVWVVMSLHGAHYTPLVVAVVADMLHYSIWVTPKPLQMLIYDPIVL